MTDAEIVALVYSVGLLAFAAFALVGALTTAARIAYYLAHERERPVLLYRDAVVMIGFATTFGLLLIGRVLVRSGAISAESLRDNVIWAVLTTAPAVIAVATYVYFELFVIERGGDHQRDYPMRQKSDDDA